jgi:hypothetical protein
VLGRALGLLSLSLIASFAEVERVRAEPMDLALTRLSVGDCALTTGPAPLRLQSDGQPTLRPDQAAWRELAMQLSSAIAPTQIDPVITSGPVGIDVALETAVASVDAGADAWARGTRGQTRATATCASRNGDVRELLISERLRVQKGLPLGFSLGAMVGKLFATSLYLVGAELKFALLEEALQSRVPDLALRIALSKTVGGGDYALLSTALEALVSERFVVARLFTISPFLGAGATFTRANSETIDLTPNIDAIACRDGVDAVCNAQGLGASADDLGHDVTFAALRLWRYRGFVGASLRYRRFALAAAVLTDLSRPRLGDRGKGERGARQWTMSLAPAVSF